MPIRRAALVALLILILVPPARGQETTAPGPPSAVGGAPGQLAAAALESVLPRRCGVWQEPQVTFPEAGWWRPLQRARRSSLTIPLWQL